MMIHCSKINNRNKLHHRKERKKPFYKTLAYKSLLHFERAKSGTTVNVMYIVFISIKDFKKINSSLPA
jgi:hypothetical protein